jgi:DNA-directed RNA polymerase specialized sigma24 family protein
MSHVTAFGLSRRPACRPARRPTRHRALACEWLDRCLNARCDESWRNLLRRYGPRIRYLIHLVAAEHGLQPSPPEVEELSQELYLYWLGRGSSFQGRTVHHFWKFVSSSVRHLVIDQVRRVTAHKRSPACDPWLPTVSLDELEAGTAGPSLLPAASALSTPFVLPTWPRGGSPESHLIARQESDLLRRRFAEQCRMVVDEERGVEVMALTLLDGHSSREVSRALRRSGRAVCESTIDSWVHRLRRHLESAGRKLPRRPREPESLWPPRLTAQRPARRTIRRTTLQPGRKIETCERLGSTPTTTV